MAVMRALRVSTVRTVQRVRGVRWTWGVMSLQGRQDDKEEEDRGGEGGEGEEEGGEEEKEEEGGEDVQGERMERRVTTVQGMRAEVSVSTVPYNRVHVTHMHITSYYIEWMSEISLVYVRPFVQPSRLVVQTSGYPDDLFSLFHPYRVITLVHSIVEETNKYAGPSLQGKQDTWSTSEEKIKTYFSFCILMRMVHQPEIQDYWSSSETFHYPPIARWISRKRFKKISCYMYPLRGQ